MSTNDKTFLSPNDKAAIGNIYNSLNTKLNSTFGQTFGESMQNISQNMKKDIVASAAALGFGQDIRRAKGEASTGTTAGVNSQFRTGFLKKLYDEYVERGSNLVSAAGESFALGGSAVASQMWSYSGGSFFAQQSQLLLMALFPAVIKPIHNKVVKSVVTKGLEFQREAYVPYVMDENGNTYDFYELLNSEDGLLGLADGGQPIMRVKVPFDQKLAEQNLCDLYNKAEQAKNPRDFKAVKSATDFVARGLKINNAIIGDTVYNIDYRTTGNATQSGQINAVIATIDLVLTPENIANGKPVRIYGRVSANGAVYLSTDSDQVKSLEFEFIVPSKGAQNPLKMADRTTTLNVPINRKTAYEMSLNEQHLDDARLILNKDLVASFNEKVVVATNAQKDQALLNYIKEKTAEMANAKALFKKYVNDETVSNRYAEFASATIDMNIARPGFTDFLHGSNIMLAKGMFDVCNAIDVKLRPEVKEFSLLSSSAAAQWVKDANGNDTTSFKLTGQVTEEDGTVGGILTPYTLSRIAMGNMYGGTYITTNRLTSTKKEVEVLDSAGAKVKANAPVHTFYMIPRFEENMDTILFLHGLERITEGVNDSEFNRDKTLQYETRYDITTYNKSLAMLEFIEAPANVNK